MKTLIPIFASALALCLNTSCYNYAGPNQRVGTVGGAIAGAGIGGIVGNQSGRGLEGAAIGGALGALGGALMGSAYDQAVYYPQEAQAAAAAGNYGIQNVQPAPVPQQVYYPQTVYVPPASPPLGYAMGGLLSNVSIGYGYSSGGYCGNRSAFSVGYNGGFPGYWGGPRHYARPSFGGYRGSYGRGYRGGGYCRY